MRKSLAWMSVAQGSFFVLQLVGSIVVARLLGPYDTGVFAVAIAVVGMIAVMQSVGLDRYLVRETDLTADVIATAATVNFGIAAIMAVIIFGCGIAGAALFDERGVREVLTVLAIVPLIGTFAFVPQAMLEREGNFRMLALIRIASTAVGMALTIALALAGYRYMSFAYSQIVTAVLTNVLINVVARRHVSFRMSLRQWRGMATFGAQMLAIAGLRRIASRIADLVLGRTLGIAALGLYSRAASNHAQIWDSVHGVVSRVVFVDFAARLREGRPLKERYLVILAMMTGLLWPMFGGVALIAGPLVNLVYGQAWLGAAGPLSLLCIASVLLVSTTMAWEVFVVSNETALQAKLEIWRTVIGTIVFVGCCFISLEAAAAARIFEAVLAQIIYRPHMMRMTGASAGDFNAVYRRSAVPTVAAIAPAAAVMAAWRFDPATPMTVVLPAIAVGIVLWLATMRALGHPLYREIMRVADRARKVVKFS